MRFIAFLIAFISTTALGAAGYVGTNTQYPIILNSTQPVSQTMPALPLSGGTLTGPLTLSGAPTMANQAATKNYTDILAGGLIPINDVVAATTSFLNAGYLNGSAGIGATLSNEGALVAFTIDGVSPTVGQRVLVKNQVAAFQNGVYTVTTVGSIAVPWVLTRATDYDTSAEILQGTSVRVTSGTINGGFSWYQTSKVTTVGSDSINFYSTVLSTNLTGDVTSVGTVTTLATVPTTKGGTGVTTGPSRILVRARYVHGATTNTLSAMTIGYVDFGAEYLSGTGPASYTALVAPQNGTLRISYNGWVCGEGTNEQEVIDTRGGSTVVYDQRKRFAHGGGCEVGALSDWVVPNVLAGDVITFMLNENNTATPITSITDPTTQVQGAFTAWYEQTYP